MTTNNTGSEQGGVIQADREAAANMWERHAGNRFDFHREITRGEKDDHYSVQAFARHRLSHSPERIRELEEEGFRRGIEAAAQCVEKMQTNNVGMVHPIAVAEASAIRSLSPNAGEG